MSNISFDQSIQLFGAVGAWISGIGTVFAVCVALWLARRVNKVKLKVHAGLRLSIGGVGQSPKELLDITVTNLGERPVTVNYIGWRIGPPKKRKLCIHLPSASSPNNIPTKLDYGETCTFWVSFEENPNWMREFSTQVVQVASRKNIRTLRLEIGTSVGHTETIVPEKRFLDAIAKELIQEEKP